MSGPQGTARLLRQAATPALTLVFYAGLVLGERAGMTLHPALGLFAVLPFLLAAVIAAVTQAERLAHVTGEPFGTLILTVAVTVIEVALIVPAAFGGKSDPALARDMIYAVIMIVCNGLVGLCLLVGGMRHHEQEFEVRGASAFLAVLAVLSVLTLVLPNYTTTAPGPALAPMQLVFVAITTLLLYGVFLYIQTVRHREFFTSQAAEGAEGVLEAGGRPFPVSGTVALLAACLLAAVLLAKTFAGYLMPGLVAIGAPPALAGFCVAFLILLPESVTALRASYANELQRSLNLALGASLATIGMTLPAVAAFAVYYGRDLALGVSAQSTLLLSLTLLVSTLTFGTGRTNILYGFVHLIVFAAYVLLIFLP
jgi:Ca2+:H+ antiporter